MFKRHRGKTKLMYFRKIGSGAGNSLRDGSLVKITDSGDISSMKNDSVDQAIGVCRLRVTATDTSSWQGAPFVPVEVPVESMVEWRIDVDTTGGAADTDVGRVVAIDTQEAGDSEATRVDISDTQSPQVLITGIESATAVFGVIVNMAGVFSNDTNDTE